jgi:hypothetical protein
VLFAVINRLAGTGGLPLAMTFTFLMGASQGVLTIVRGAVL